MDYTIISVLGGDVTALATKAATTHHHSPNCSEAIRAELASINRLAATSPAGDVSDCGRTIAEKYQRTHRVNLPRRFTCRCQAPPVT
jgi:hypothetical protein